MALGFMDGAKDTEISNKLSDAALNASADLKPEGDTGIGGAMERAADMLLPSPASRRQVMVVLTDGRENVFAQNDVVGGCGQREFKSCGEFGSFLAE